MDISQNLNAVRPHIVHVLKTIFQCFFKAELRRITVKRHAALGAFFLVIVHYGVSLLLRELDLFALSS